MANKKQQLSSGPSGHTPAPWSFDETWCLITGPQGGGEQIAAIHGSELVTRNTAYANAHLICAAPEMLATLKEISHECADTPAMLSEAALGIIQIKVRAVIARAEGH